MGIRGASFLPRRFDVQPVQASLTAILFCLNANEYFLLLLLAAAIHEAGHLICAGLCSRGVESMSLGLMGARIRLESGGSYLRDAVVAFGGAGANLLSLLPAWWGIRFWRGGEAAIFFFFCSLFLALMNLLPAPGLDGGMLLHSLAAWRRDLSFADGLLRACGAVTVILLLAISLFLWRSTGNLSLWIVCVSLFWGFAGQ